MKVLQKNFIPLVIFTLTTFCSCERATLENNFGYIFTMDSVAKENKTQELIKKDIIKKVKGEYLLNWEIPGLDSSIQSILDVEFDIYERELNHLNTITLHLVRDTTFYNINSSYKEGGYMDTVLNCPIDINALINIEKALTNFFGKPDSVIGSIKKVELINNSKNQETLPTREDILERYSEKRFDERLFLEKQIYGSYDRNKSKKVIWKKNGNIIILDYSYSVNDNAGTYDEVTGEFKVFFGKMINNYSDNLFAKYQASYPTNKWYSYPKITIVSSKYFKEVYELRRKKRSSMKVDDYVSIEIDKKNCSISKLNNYNLFNLKICLAKIKNIQVYNQMPVSSLKFKFLIYDKFEDLLFETADVEYTLKSDLGVNMAELNHFGGWCYEVFMESKKDLNLRSFSPLNKEVFEKEIKIIPVVEAIVFKDGTVLKRK
jgi:hypothetical protein